MELCFKLCPIMVIDLVERNLLPIESLREGDFFVSTFIYRHLQGNPDQQRFTIPSGAGY